MKNKILWGNGVGIEPKLWFNKPKRFHTKITKGSFGTIIEDFVPVGDKKSNFFDGGYWIDKTGINLCCGESITCLSESYDEVLKFTKLVKEMLKYNDYWQNKFFKKLKRDFK